LVFGTERPADNKVVAACKFISISITYPQAEVKRCGDAEDVLCGLSPAMPFMPFWFRRGWSLPCGCQPTRGGWRTPWLL